MPCSSWSAFNRLLQGSQYTCSCGCSTCTNTTWRVACSANKYTQILNIIVSFNVSQRWCTSEPLTRLGSCSVYGSMGLRFAQKGYVGTETSRSVRFVGYDSKAFVYSLMSTNNILANRKLAHVTTMITSFLWKVNPVLLTWGCGKWMVSPRRPTQLNSLTRMRPQPQPGQYTAVSVHV